MNKVCLIGCADVGKTTYVHHLLNSPLTSRKRKRIGVEVRAITYKNQVFNIWDTEDINANGLIDGYIIMSNMCIIMYRYGQNLSTLDESIRTILNAIPDKKKICIYCNVKGNEVVPDSYQGIRIFPLSLNKNVYRAFDYFMTGN